MKKEIDLLDLFSGIGGFAKGLMDAGFTIKNHMFSEIDKHAIANYKYNFKNATNLGSVTDISTTNFRRPDIITFGSPCQDFSIAGNQDGLKGSRSSLILEAIRIVGELKPPVFIWENVKGTFSSNNGEDFWQIIAAFANIGGYRLEWQLLNTMWFLPQNRERIYLIGHLAGSSKPGIFPFQENDRIFRKTNKANRLQPQTKYSSTTLGTGNMRATDTFIEVPRTSRCLTGGGKSGGLHSDMTVVKIYSPTLKGYEIASVGDSISLSHLNSKTRRGRVSKLAAQTLDTSNNQAIISSLNHYKNDKVVHGDNIDAFVLNLRRMTEIEWERLQGLLDNWTKFGVYETMPGTHEVKKIAKTHRYRLIGNAVTAYIVKAIGERIEIIE